MEYDIIIVTRNRHTILPLSIALMLSQDRLANQLIIIDSSDDHEKTITIAEKAIMDSGKRIALRIEKSQPGIPLQRNFGLTYAKSEIVMFPDDDALWFPGVAEQIMNIYEMDRDAIIGAIGATEVLQPPPNSLREIDHLDEMEVRDRIHNALGRKLRKLESKGFPDPISVACDKKIREKQIPSWLAEANAIVDAPITGFRMTFRRDAIAQYGFDETLGRYALFEDYDASLSILQKYLIVRSVDAKVFHHRSPEKRTNGFEWGVIQILNKAYVVCKHTEPKTRPRQLIKQYCWYKIVRYLMQAGSGYGQARLTGALMATRKLNPLIDASADELVKQYRDIRDECLKHS